MTVRQNLSKTIYIFALALLAVVLFPTQSYAQEQQKEKTPEEMASLEAERLEKELKLNATQVFYVDSVLQYNYSKLKEDMERLQQRGMQDPKSYTTVRDRWIDTTLVAFKKIMTEQQYISYLKSIGRGKEYKKGKDGNYYIKNDKKKR